MKINRFLYLIKEGLRGIFIHGFMSFASVTIIVACLLIMGCFSLLSLNIDSVIEELEQENEILAFVDETYTTEEAQAIELRLSAVENVSSVVFVTREQALEDFASQYDDPSLFEDIGSDILRDRYIIYLKDIALMEETAEEIGQVRGIDDVNAHLEISRGFVTIRNVVSIISMLLVAILFVISVFIMSNTIKLATYGRKEEIAIMKMVGAGNGFIRMPFVIEGLVLGALGGAIAFFIQWGIYQVVIDKLMNSLIGTLITVIPFSALKLPILAVFLLVGLVVGIFGGNIAIRNYLKV